jgi:hypothetical protein
MQRSEERHDGSRVHVRRQVDCSVVPIAAELDGAPDLADKRAMQALVPFVRLPVVGIGEPDRAVLALGMDAMLAGSECDFQDVAHGLAVGEERDAAELEQTLVLGPGPHLLVMARHAVVGEVQAHDEIGTVPAYRLGVSGDLGVVGHCGSMYDGDLACQPRSISTPPRA